MALIVDLPQTEVGVPMAATYARVVMVRADKDGLQIQVLHYASAEARAAGAQPVLNQSFHAPTSELDPATHPVHIAYEWLKKQPGYAAAESC